VGGAGLAGHLWTIGPGLVAQVRRPAVPPARDFRVELEDPVAGRLALTGRLHERAGARALLVVLHGLAGSCESPYARRFARRAVATGHACLRLNFRGADGGAADFYHAGLTADLDVVLEAPEVRAFERVFLVGFSLGGHTALRWAGERGGTRAAGIVAVCAPLDLDRGATALDGPGNGPYRYYLLRGLKDLADEVERMRPGALAAPRERRRRARGIREWDGLVVAPRWGFASAEDYYVRVSAGATLAGVRTPTWLVLSEQDPMVPADTVRPSLGGASAAIEVTWTRRGGHVGFPANLDLGRRAPRGLDAQLLAWIAAHL
jgi:hypothetical protein